MSKASHETDITKALEDLLGAIRTSRDARVGRELAPLLVNHAWQNDAELFIEIQKIIEAELHKLRLKVGLAHVAKADPEVQVAADWNSASRDLRALGVLHAYCLEGLDATKIGEIIGRASNTVTGQVDKGYTYLARVLTARISGAPKPELRHADGQQLSQTDQLDGTKASTPTLQEAKSPAAEPDRRGEDRGRLVIHNRGVMITGPVQTLKIAPQAQAASGSTQAAPPRASDDSLSRAWALLGTVVAAVLVATAPQISVGALIALIGWMLARQPGRLAADAERIARADDRRWWNACYILLWIVALGWALSLLVEMPRLAAPEMTMARLLLIVRFLAIFGMVFLLVVMDTLFRASTPGVDGWLWQNFKSQGEWLWQQRWTALSVAWLVMIALSLALLLPPLRLM